MKLVAGLMHPHARHRPGLAPRQIYPLPWPKGTPSRRSRGGEDPRLVELLGVQGAAQSQALFDGFPEAVGILWAIGAAWVQELTCLRVRVIVASHDERQLAQDNVRRLVFDLAGLTFIDSAGLGALLAIRDRTQDLGIESCLGTSRLRCGAFST